MVIQQQGTAAVGHVKSLIDDEAYAPSALDENAAKKPVDRRGLAALLHAPGAKARSATVEGIHFPS
jgi:hypothetical protein